jgi:hypothetical protein
VPGVAVPATMATRAASRSFMFGMRYSVWRKTMHGCALQQMQRGDDQLRCPTSAKATREREAVILRWCIPLFGEFGQCERPW